MEAAIVFLIAGAAFGVWGLISPEGMWNATQSWRYKNPEANRPSEAQHTMTRVGSGIGIVVALIMIPMLIDLDKTTQRQHERDSYQDCLAEHRGEDSLLSPEESCENLDPDSTSSDSDYDSDLDDYDSDLDDYDSDLDDYDF